MTNDLQTSRLDTSRSTGWPAPTELRIGLGCMRLSTDENRDDELALATIAEAVAAGVTVLDTARSYGLGPSETGHNERLLARGLRLSGAETTARVVTKGGMSRTAGGGWLPDGRARTIRADCEASLADLDRLPIDLFLLHAPDPRRPWRTSVRALERLVAEGLVRRVGLSNVNRGELDEALELAPIAAVEVALNPYDDRALRAGVVARCAGEGITVIAHSPLGGPRRASRLSRREPLAEIARRHDASAAEVALAWVLALVPGLVAIPGARRPETVRSAVRAADLELEPDELEQLASAFGEVAPPRSTGQSPRATTDVVMIMGIPGAGKTRVAEEYVGRGYERLNRDERGGTLRAIASVLDELLSAGAGRVVLDNTYLTRATRSHVVETAARHGAAARCIWVETPLVQAQVNLVERLLDRYGTILDPDELARAARSEPGILTPTSQMRALRELEPPAEDEGFATIERVSFTRAAPPPGVRRGVFVAASAFERADWQRTVAAADPGAPHLIFDWRPGGDGAELCELGAALAADVSSPIETALCPHPGGPPTCWCRPPLPGLLLAFARNHGVAPSRSTLVGTSAAHRTLATALGARFVEV
jgi:aryl-alcohol dehydrogenase-like predicted oxidoreductase